MKSVCRVDRPPKIYSPFPRDSQYCTNVGLDVSRSICRSLPMSILRHMDGVLLLGYILNPTRNFIPSSSFYFSDSIQSARGTALELCIHADSV